MPQTSNRLTRGWVKRRLRLSKTSRRHLRRSAHCVGRCSTIGPWGTMLVVVRFPPSRDCSTQCKSAATIVGRFARQAYHGTHTRLQNDGFACRHRKGCRHSCLEGSFLACVSDDCGMLLRLVWWCRHCFARYTKFGVSQSNVHLDALLTGLETVLAQFDPRQGGSTPGDHTLPSRDSLLYDVWSSLVRVAARGGPTSSNAAADGMLLLQLPPGLGPLSLLCYLRLVASLLGRFGHLPILTAGPGDQTGAPAAQIQTDESVDTEVGTDDDDAASAAGIHGMHDEPSVFAVLRTVCALLDPRHIDALLHSSAWRLGGALAGVALLLRSVCARWDSVTTTPWLPCCCCPACLPMHVMRHCLESMRELPNP